MEDAVVDDHCKVRCFESKTLRFFFPMLMSDEWNEEFWEFGQKKKSVWTRYFQPWEVISHENDSLFLPYAEKTHHGGDA